MVRLRSDSRVSLISRRPHPPDGIPNRVGLAPAERKHLAFIVMRVLLTGVSGTGKSSLVRELQKRGYSAFDADDDGLTEPRPDGAWGWRGDLVAALLDQYDDDLIFFAGCSDEQTQFEFDFKVLL